MSGGRSILGSSSKWDPDLVCAYSTGRTVEIRDRWLGILFQTFRGAILVYVIIYTVILGQAYMKPGGVTGLVRTTLRAPTSEFRWPNGLAPYCLFSDQVNYTQYDYSMTSSRYQYLGYNGVDSPRRACQYTDARYVLPLTSTTEIDGLFIPTRTEVITEQVAPLTPECIAQRNASCAWTTLSDTFYYTADTEYFTLLVDHSVATEHGTSFSSTDLEGALIGPDGKRMDPCTAYTNNARLVASNISCPSFVNVGNRSANVNDVLPLRALLNAAGIVTLDETAGTAAAVQGNSRRAGGVVLIVTLHYTNYYQKRDSAPEGTGTMDYRRIKYFYDVAAVPNSRYKAEQVFTPDNGYPSSNGTRTVYVRSGVRIIFQQVGVLGTFDFNTMLINLTTALGLLSVAVLITDFIAFNVCKQRHIYRQYQSRKTVDMSDVRDAEDMAVLDRFKKEDYLVDPIPSVFVELLQKRDERMRQREAMKAAAKRREEIAATRQALKTARQQLTDQIAGYEKDLEKLASTRSLIIKNLETLPPAEGGDDPLSPTSSTSASATPGQGAAAVQGGGAAGGNIAVAGAVTTTAATAGKGRGTWLSRLSTRGKGKDAGPSPLPTTRIGLERELALLDAQAAQIRDMIGVLQQAVVAVDEELNKTKAAKRKTLEVLDGKGKGGGKGGEGEGGTPGGTGIEMTVATGRAKGGEGTGTGGGSHAASLMVAATAVATSAAVSDVIVASDAAAANTANGNGKANTSGGASANASASGPVSGEALAAEVENKALAVFKRMKVEIRGGQTMRTLPVPYVKPAGASGGTGRGGKPTVQLSIAPPEEDDPGASGGASGASGTGAGIGLPKTGGRLPKLPIPLPSLGRQGGKSGPKASPPASAPSSSSASTSAPSAPPVTGNGTGTGTGQSTDSVAVPVAPSTPATATAASTGRPVSALPAPVPVPGVATAAVTAVPRRAASFAQPPGPHGALLSASASGTSTPARPPPPPAPTARAVGPPPPGPPPVTLLAASPGPASAPAQGAVAGVVLDPTSVTGHHSASASGVTPASAIATAFAHASAYPYDLGADSEEDEEGSGSGEVDGEGLPTGMATARDARLGRPSFHFRGPRSGDVYTGNLKDLLGTGKEGQGGDGEDGASSSAAAPAPAPAAGSGKGWFGWW